MSTMTTEPASATESPAAAQRRLAADKGSVLPRPSPLAAAWMLAWREWVRFFRQRNRVVAAIVQPLMFWLLFGTGLRGSFQGAEGIGFLEFFLPGTVGLILLFTAIFATISVIEDRREGFMQSVLVAPVGRWPVLAGKVLGGSAIAWVQASLFLVLIWAVGTAAVGWTSIPLLILMFVLAVAMCALGMIVAWPMESTQGFHAIMMLGLMPMWLLSGAFFPVPALGDSTTTGQMVLGWVMRVNPLSYGMTEMRRLLYPAVDFAAHGWAPSQAVCWAVSIGFMFVMIALALWVMRGTRKADLVS
jgi:ABC-2 type transport system permease protein